MSRIAEIMQLVPEILYEDNHLIVVRKPHGLLTQGDNSGDLSLLDIIKGYIKWRDHKPGNVFLGMVQRLDRPVSGTIIFAKTSKAAGRLSAQIRKHQIGKLYTVLTCSGDLLGSTMNKWLDVENQLLRVRHKTRVVQSPSRFSRPALLRMKTLHANEHSGFHLVELVTGRKHQIRSQLAHLGLPVSGDRKYGSNQSYPLPEGIGLHAVCCRFEHPVRQREIVITAPLPESFSSCFSVTERQRIRSLLTAEIGDFGAGALQLDTRVM